MSKHDDSGGYIEVTSGACAADSSKTCGTISKAFNTQGPNPKYVNLGKSIVKDMTSDDGENYSGGTV